MGWVGGWVGAASAVLYGGKREEVLQTSLDLLGMLDPQLLGRPALQFAPAGAAHEGLFQERYQVDADGKDGDDGQKLEPEHVDQLHFEAVVGCAAGRAP